MKIKLKQISIKNFKGCKDRVMDLSDKTAIKGQNGSGKTTIADAFSWVLFNKDSNGSTNFDIRPKDKEGNDIDFIDIEVKLQLEVNEKPLELVKVQKQKWVKKRGSEEQTYEGNENLYEINTIPKSEKEFKAYITDLVDEEVFKFASNTGAFMAQKPADRRETLFKLVSDVTDDDVISSDEKLSSLRNLLDDFTADELVSKNAKALKEYKKHLEEIPARIDEVSKTIVEVDYSEKELELLGLKKDLEEVESEIASNSKGFDEINKVKNQISEIDLKLGELTRKGNKELQNVRSNIQSNIDEMDNLFNRLHNIQKNIESRIENKKSVLSGLDKLLTDLGNQYKAEKTKEFDAQQTFCPTCKQELPETQKSDLIANFEGNKNNKMLEINKQGKTVAENIKAEKDSIQKLEAELENIKADKLKANADKNGFIASLDEIPTNADMTANLEYQTLTEDKAKLEATLNSLINGSAEDVKLALQSKKRDIQSKIDEANRFIAGKIAIENAKVRVEELKAEQKDLSQKIANVEKELYLLEEFNKAKVNLLSDKINQHFKIVKWKLFERQINGGYKPICEPLVNGQAYNSGLNSGHKILAELDIIQALQKIYEVQVPVFLDNAERINDYNIPEMECQLITLSVTEDRELKVEVM